MSSKMEQIIEEIEDYIEGCKAYPLSNTKIVVNKEELEELIDELKTKTPEEIKAIMDECQIDEYIDLSPEVV